MLGRRTHARIIPTSTAAPARPPKKQSDRSAILLLLCIVFGLGLQTAFHYAVSDDVAAPSRVFAAPPAKRPQQQKRSDVQRPPPQQQRKQPTTTTKVSAARHEDVPLSQRPFGAYLSKGGRLPVVMLACDRPEETRDALTSLLASGVDRADVAVVQDGDDEAVRAVAREFGISFKRNGIKHRHPDDGAAVIAASYGAALRWALDEHFLEAPGVVVVEDDLLFSPDFADYFELVGGPLLDADDTVFVVSAWNDNGFFDDDDKRALRRSTWFPGLGWLLSRERWRELGPKWPKTHWDHWLRDMKQHQGRECVFPAVPRTFHAGKQGTFMDDWHDGRYFAPIKHNLDATFTWHARDYEAAIRSNYESRLRSILSGPASTTLHLGSFDRLPGQRRSDVVGENDHRPIAFWYSWQPNDGNAWWPPDFVCVSEPFRLWHEHQRTDHYGVHEALFQGRRLLLVNAVASHYAPLKPPDLHPLLRSHCPERSWADLGRLPLVV